MSRGPGHDDDFLCVPLDEDFVRGATVTELSARRRAKPPRSGGFVSRFLRRLKRLTITALVLVVVGVAGWMDYQRSSPQILQAAPDSHTSSSYTAFDGPTPKRAASKIPLGTPPNVSANGEPYAFIGTQEGSAAPVAYDPCRPINVVINEAQGPANGTRLINAALAEMSAATGLQFIVEGTTDEPATQDRNPYQPDRYGDRWAPVLIAWSNPTESPRLKGDILGFGGSASVTSERHPSVYVSGAVVLDAPDVFEFLDHKKGEKWVHALLLHELAHVVGLDHVEDDSQIMNPRASEDVVALQAGDRAGLAELGRGACIERL
jgi:hypothetical protein